MLSQRDFAFFIMAVNTLTNKVRKKRNEYGRHEISHRFPFENNSLISPANKTEEI